MINTGQLVKETVLFGTVNVALPTVDVCTDGVLIFDLFRGYPYHPSCFSLDEHNVTIFNQTCLDQIPRDQLEHENHPIWGTLMLVPFRVTYLTGWYKWHHDFPKFMTEVSSIMAKICNINFWTPSPFGTLRRSASL